MLVSGWSSICWTHYQAFHHFSITNPIVREATKFTLGACRCKIDRCKIDRLWLNGWLNFISQKRLQIVWLASHYPSLDLQWLHQAEQHDVPICLKQDSWSQILVLIPPVAGACCAAAGTKYALIQAVELVALFSSLVKLSSSYPPEQKTKTIDVTVLLLSACHQSSVCLLHNSNYYHVMATQKQCSN